MQHEPTRSGFVEAHLDEVVAGAEGAQVQAVVGAFELRIFVGDLREAAGKFWRHSASTPAGLRPRRRRRGLPKVLPWGTAASMALRRAWRLSGRSAAVSEVRAAIMPQPMSTPTAAGMIAPTVGMTLPMVEPLPRCTSGITARCRKMKGIRAVFISCWRASSSTGTPRVHSRIGAPPGTGRMSWVGMADYRRSPATNLIQIRLAGCFRP